MVRRSWNRVPLFARVVALAIATSLAAVSLRASAAQPGSGSTVLTGVRLIDGTGRPAVENATIVITNGRVEAVGGASLKGPAGATVINLPGKTVVPGLINAHGHLGAGDKKLPLNDQII